MKWVELRRHSIVDKDKNVSPEGVKFAQWTRAQLSLNYNAYYCSPLVRTQQTMEAFGFLEYKIDDAFIVLSGERLKPFMPGVNRMAEEKGIGILEAFFHVPETFEAIKERATGCLAGIRRVADDLADGGSALVVSHGGTIEPAALLVKDNWDLQCIGGPLNECEGIIFKFDGDEIIDIYTARIKRWGYG